MKTKLYNIVGSVFFVVLSSCSLGFYKDLDRTPDDPYAESPVVGSYKVADTILVTWSDDKGTDEYILERTEDGSFLHWVEVYRGTKNTYEDHDVRDRTKYLYRLSKQRGKKVFGPWKSALGVGSCEVEDDLEDNNTPEKATFLSTETLYANMLYWVSYFGDEISDVDWYYFDIPPGWFVTVVIYDKDIRSDTTETHFKIYIPGRGISSITQSDPVDIDNPGLTVWRCYFKIFPNEYQYVADSNSGGGNLVHYKIEKGAEQRIIK
jgi:hypothetical protein